MRNVVYTAIAVSLIALGLIILLNKEGEPAPEVAQLKSSDLADTPTSSSPLSSQPAPQNHPPPSMSEKLASESERYKITQDEALALLSQSELQPGDLKRTLERIKGLCRRISDCDQFIADVLEAYPNREYAELAKNALERWPSYDEGMGNIILSTSQSAREKFETIQQVRRETLGEQESDLLFGQEEAWANLKITTAEFSENEAPYLDAQARLARLNEIREHTLGNYSEAISQQESTHDQYNLEFLVLQAGLDNQEQIDALQQSLRIKHFGEEKTLQMEARDDQIEQQQQQVKDYWELVAEMETELEPLKNQLPENQWKQLHQRRLSEIRLSVFKEGGTQ